MYAYVVWIYCKVGIEDLFLFFDGNHVVLVNSCQSQEVSIIWDLKQDDPLLLSFFLLVAESLSGMCINVFIK